MNKNKFKIMKICIFIIFIVIAIFLTIKFLPLFKSLSTQEGRLEFKSQIDNLGIKGIFIIVGLMFIQVLLVFLPGEPVELLAGICYGPIGGLMIIFLGSFISSVLIFFAVKKYGRSFVYGFLNEEKIKKIENSKCLKDKSKLELIMFLIFFTPGTPKDLFVYIGGLLPIDAIRFILISTFARFPSIISSTLVGSNIAKGMWSNAIVIYGISFAISGIIILISNYVRKKYVGNEKIS